MKTLVTCTVNGEERAVLADTRDTLLELLRDRIGLTGTKEGCGNGNCGTCTVLVDGAAVCACLMLALEAPGRDIVTIEGLARRRAPPDPAGARRTQRYAMRLLHAGHRAVRQGVARRQTRAHGPEIRHAIAGNLCRCTGYGKIVEAIAAAAAAMRGNRRWPPPSPPPGHRQAAAARRRQGARHRPGDLPGRLAAGHGARQAAAQPAGARAHRPHRHLARGGAEGRAGDRHRGRFPRAACRREHPHGRDRLRHVDGRRAQHGPPQGALGGSAGGGRGRRRRARGRSGARPHRGRVRAARPRARHRRCHGARRAGAARARLHQGRGAAAARPATSARDGNRARGCDARAGRCRGHRADERPGRHRATRATWSRRWWWRRSMPTASPPCGPPRRASSPPS